MLFGSFINDTLVGIVAVIMGWLVGWFSLGRLNKWLKMGKQKISLLIVSLVWTVIVMGLVVLLMTHPSWAEPFFWWPVMLIRWLGESWLNYSYVLLGLVMPSYALPFILIGWPIIWYVWQLGWWKSLIVSLVMSSTIIIVSGGVFFGWIIIEEGCNRWEIFHEFNAHLKEVCWREDKGECPKNENELKAFNPKEYQRLERCAEMKYAFEEKSENYEWVVKLKFNNQALKALQTVDEVGFEVLGIK